MSKNICPYCAAPVGYLDKLKPLYSLRSQFVRCPNCDKKISDFWKRVGLGVGMSGFGVGYFSMRANDYPYISLAIVLFLYLAVFLLLPAVFDLNQCDHVDAETVRKKKMAQETEINGGRLLILLGFGLSSLIALLWILSP